MLDQYDGRFRIARSGAFKALVSSCAFVAELHCDGVLTMSASSPAASSRRSYPWLPVLIVGMTIVAFVIGVVMLRSIEVRMVEATGENLTLASAEIADKLDRLLFERHGDVRMMARAFSGRPLDKKYLNEYLQWTKETYAPVYLWLGVADAQGRMIAATEPEMVGQ